MPRSGLSSPTGHPSRRAWRFSDLGSRLEYLLAGFGWCYIPAHLADEYIAAGRLKRLDIKEHRDRVLGFPIHAIHERGLAPGRTGRRLIDNLRGQLAPMAAETAASG